MSGLTVFLIAVGLADALRRLTRPLWQALTLAPVAVVVTALLAGLWHLGEIPLLVIAAAASIGWRLLCAAQSAPAGTRPRRWCCSPPPPAR